MKTSNVNPTRTILTAAIVSLLLTNPFLPAFATDEFSVEENGNCAFSKQLENEYERILFVNQLRSAKEASASRYGEVFSNSVTAVLRNGETMVLDSFSVGCMSCHDGISAPGKDIRYKNNSNERYQDILSVKGSHPIGMHYGSYAYSSREFKPQNTLHPDMVLIDGKVGCLTCHNPMNPRKNHMAANNDRSRLCFACHRK